MYTIAICPSLPPEIRLIITKDAFKLSKICHVQPAMKPLVVLYIKVKGIALHRWWKIEAGLHQYPPG